MAKICIITATIVLIGVLGPGAVGAEVPAENPAQLARPALQAMRIETAPTIDGDVLEDPAWEGVPAANGFRQTAPDEGRFSSQNTDVYVAYTADTLYFGIVCHDTDPEGIIVADSRRDSSLVETDSIQIILDTYLDQQTGYVFGTNPVGIEYDGQVTREGEGGFATAGGFNKNWDGVWEVKSRITDKGWSTELAIPFTTIRFPRGSQEQTWGMNVQRNIRRRNETAFWSPLPRQFNLYRLSLAGTLNGLEVPKQRNLKIAPYVLGDWQRPGVEEADTEGEGEFGVDLKYSLSPSMTFDATYNTDFAQVEVDELQINLERFNLFFPEKRPFFLENAGYFSVGVPEETELFFSRRIGIGPEGEIVPIVGGVRLSGKAAERYNVGALYMRTEEVVGVTPENDFAVARLSRDLPNRSAIGGLFTSRQGRGREALDQDYSRTYSLDGRWGIGQNGLIQGFAALTDTPGTEEGEHAFNLSGRYDSEKWSFSTGYTEVAEDFNPEVGFLRRSGYRKPDVFLMRRIRPESLWGLLELRPHFSYRGFWDFDGFQETGYLHVDNHWEWRNGYEVHTGINFTREGLTEPFEIFEDVIIPEGTYDNTEAQIVFYTNRGAPVAFQLRAVIGGFYGGDRINLVPGFRFRIGDTFNTEISWSYNDIDLPEGAFKTNLGRLRLSYSFTPSIFIQALVQYNDVDEIWGTNLRFAWLRTANTGLHVVYNEVRDFADVGTGIPDRQLIVKYSYLFDVLK
jgi:hypothetical protein